LEHCDFETQKHIVTEDGALRPDLVVSLPGGKTLVVDSKAPLEAYLQAIDEKDESKRRERLRDHALQIRRHIASLGDKAYWKSLPFTPEFVVCSFRESYSLMQRSSRTLDSLSMASTVR